MAKNPQMKCLLNGDNRINTPENDDIKYKEIKDRNMPLIPQRENGNINVGSPINCDIQVAGGGNGDSTNNRHITSVLGDKNLLTDRDTVPCPTCRGAGTIHADDSSLVALIPVKDERLKPKRTKLKIAIAIILTLLICGVTLYFLFPRSPTIRLVSITQYNASIPDTGDAYILFKNHYAVKNENFVSVDLTSISLTVTHQKVQVAGPDPFYKFRTKTVDLRSSTNFDVYINTTFSSQNRDRHFLKYICMYGGILGFDISTELHASFLFHTETISVTDNTYVQCHYNGTAAM